MAMMMAQQLRTTAFDDQMVPEISFDVVTVDAGATVFETIPNVQTASKPLPDFDSLLEEFNDFNAEANCVVSNNSSISNINNSLMDASSLSSLKTWDLESYSELSMYEDSPYQGLKPEKLNIEIKQEVVTDSPLLFQPLLPAQEEFGLADTVEFADLKTRIEYLCATLDIPSDPCCWSSEHTKRWVQWTLKSYNLPEYHCEQFVMSGSALCYLSQEDFRQRSPQTGEFLCTELDIWRTAHNLVLGTDYNQEEFYQEEPPTFTDLDSVSVLPQVNAPLPHNMQHQQQPQPMKCIPTPVITCTSPYQAASPMTSSLNPCLADSPVYTPAHSSSGSSLMSVSPAPSLESLSNTSSSGNSWSCMQTSRDLEDSPSEMPQTTFQDVHTVPCVPHHGKHTIHLWQFLKELLLQPHAYQSCIRWLDRSKGIFKIEDSARVAKLWGGRKNRPAMNYDKLSRSIRQYYKKGIIKKTTNSKRLVYQFCPNYL